MDCSTITIRDFPRYAFEDYNKIVKYDVIIGAYNEGNKQIYLHGKANFDDTIIAINHETLHKILHETINVQSCRDLDKYLWKKELTYDIDIFTGAINNKVPRSGI